MSRWDAPRGKQRDEYDAVQLTVYVAEAHLAEHRSRVDELLRQAALTGVSGGTVLAGYEGFGRHHSHTPRLFHRADETPLSVVFVDRPERIEMLLPIVDQVLPDAVVVTERVRAIRYTQGSDPGPGPGADTAPPGIGGR